MDLKVRSVSDLSEGNFLLRTEKPKELSFEPGQYFSVSVSNMGINREYSVSSGNKEDELEFMIRQIDDGTLSPNLRKLVKNHQISLNGPFGKFIIEKDSFSKKLLFIASGTGVAPFKSFIKSYKNLNFTLLHGARTFEDLKINLKDQTRIIPCVSRQKGTKYKRVTDFLNNEDLSIFEEFYLCGNSSMITDSIEILQKKNISTNNIFMETYF
tara:strand:+ start:489 stop:1124 length:636 start_codon:yes stop_codon:yes gene_type:complete